MRLLGALPVVLGVTAGLAFYAAGYTHGYVEDQLDRQQIFFPPAEAFSEDEQDLLKYAGEQVDTGPEAKVFGEDYIGRHLANIAGGQTYSQVSSAARQEPEDPALQGQVQSLFRGETLRFMLLEADGWWTVGDIARYAGIALSVAAFIALAALGFEFWLLARGAGRQHLVQDGPGEAAGG